MYKQTIAILLFLAISVSGQVPDKAKVVAGAERAFEKAAKTNPMPAPGCAVGVSLSGQSVFEKAFGLAEMEHGVSNTPQTIFESGSVAKQFTAAALVLLQQDGKLDLDDPVRKYIPELPDYGSPLTIRHLLNHTAGLRDWGAVMALTGVGRGDRVISQKVALDVIYRQKNLDFKPGAEYSYSNSGYQLAAEIVERVSKQKFSAFTEERLLKPLGMKNSSWRDDYQRLTPGRAQAYSRQGNGPWMLNMPIMNVIGNGGMLTTVGDWLKWNAMLDAKTWNANLVEELETQGVLNDGRKIEYALGLNVGTYRGMRDVSHGGSTAGYQTFLARYPDQKVSVAVLCNGTNPGAGRIAADITDEIFGPFPQQATGSAKAATIAAETLQNYVGLWRNERTRYPSRTTLENGKLLLNGRPLTPLPNGSFQYGPSKVSFKLAADGKPDYAVVDTNGDVIRHMFAEAWTPSAKELSALVGVWHSEEAEAAFNFVLEDGKAFLTQRPTTKLPLTPLFKDHFSIGGVNAVAWVIRDKEGKIVDLHVGGSRMRDMPFTRVK